MLPVTESVKINVTLTTSVYLFSAAEVSSNGKSFTVAPKLPIAVCSEIIRKSTSNVPFCTPANLNSLPTAFSPLFFDTSLTPLRLSIEVCSTSPFTTE